MIELSVSVFIDAPVPELRFLRFLNLDRIVRVGGFQQLADHLACFLTCFLKQSAGDDLPLHDRFLLLGERGIVRNTDRIKEIIGFIVDLDARFIDLMA